MMQILLKYCGGCNPDINRSKIVDEVKRGLPPDINLVSKVLSEPADLGIMMSGCPSSCLNRDEILQLAKQWIIVSGNYVNYFPVDNDKLAAYIIQKILDYQEKTNHNSQFYQLFIE